MKLLVPVLASALSALSSFAFASERARSLLDIEKRLPFTASSSADLGPPVVLPSFPVRGLREGAVSERTLQSLDRLFAAKRDEPGPIEVSPRKPSFLRGFDSSPITELSLRGSELRKLRDGFDLGSLGTFYVHSGVRWHVGGDQYLSRGLSSSHGGAMLDQTYAFRNQHDLWREFVKKPIEKLLDR